MVKKKMYYKALKSVLGSANCYKSLEWNKINTKGIE